MNQEAQPLRVLALSGSLRVASSNTALLLAARTLAPAAGMEIHLFGGLSDLPHFNPDLDGMETPSVLEFRERLRAVDGVLISTPEYAHGVPGTLKNALDWVVSSGELVNKPIALLKASAFAVHAHTSLVETLTVMSARVVAEASVIVPLGSNKIDAQGILAHAEAPGVMKDALVKFAAAMQTARLGAIE